MFYITRTYNQQRTDSLLYITRTHNKQLTGIMLYIPRTLNKQLADIMLYITRTHNKQLADIMLYITRTHNHNGRTVIYNKDPQSQTDGLLYNNKIIDRSIDSGTVGTLWYQLSGVK